jgi:hypothetical protein
MTLEDFKRAANLWSSSEYPFLKNTAIIEKFYREADWDAPVDFIGPGIDRGFRIQNFATTARMPVSLDLAYLMALSALPFRDSDNQWAMEGHGLDNRFVSHKSVLDHLSKRGDIGNPHAPKLFEGAQSVDHSPAITRGLGVFYAGDALLKGVIGGAPYPNLWIDTQTPKSLDSRKEALLGGKREPIVWETLLGFCESFLDDRSDYMFAPFILNEAGSKTKLPKHDSYDFNKYLEDYRLSMVGSSSDSSI